MIQNLLRFAVLVTAERLVAIKDPLRAQSMWTGRRVLITVLAVLLGSLALQLHNFAAYRPVTVPLCGIWNRTTHALHVVRPEEQGPLLAAYVRLSMTLGPVFQVGFYFTFFQTFNSM